MKRDNSTFERKCALRLRMLKQVNNPIVLETHGGYGKLYEACYAHILAGVVIEKDTAKSTFLAEQREMWAVYQADCITALREGIGKQWSVNFVDIDPYGDPWHVVDAFLFSERPHPDKLVIVVNDGLRQKVKMGGAWAVSSLTQAVAQFGNAAIYNRYLQVCRWLMNEKATQAGYALDSFVGYYCGHLDQMTHYGAVLTFS